MANNKEIHIFNVVIMGKYGIVGLLGTALHFALLILFVELIHFNPVIASSMGFIVVLIVSYYLNRKWTFRNTNRTNKQFIKYTLVSLTGLMLNVLIMFYFVEILKYSYFIGQVCVTLVIPVSNYLLNSLWTFKN